MKWGAPEHLVWLWLLPVLGWLAFWLLRRRLRALHQLIAPALLPASLRDAAPRRARQRLVCWLAAMTLLVAAFSRPQWGFRWEEVKQRGLDILVVLDTSRSMLAQDVKPNRLQQAKWGVRDFVRQLKGDRIGLLAFAGDSFLQCPLTIDYAAFLMTLEDVYCGIIPRGGTAITQALTEALDSFEQDTEADRAIILITDGDDHEGDPLRLVDELKRRRVRVFAIGIGSRDGDLIPAENGAVGFLKDRAGNTVKSALREDVLEQLALATGGAYVRSAPGDSGLERIFEQGLSKLKRTDGESKMIKSYEDRFPWLLALAFALLVLEAALPPPRRTREEGA